MTKPEPIIVGNILPRANGPDLNKSRWVELIDKHPNLRRPKPRRFINPFNQQPTMSNPPSDYALVLINDQEVGAMHWYLNEEIGICVWANREADLLIPVATDVAELLSGQFVSE